MATLMQVPRSGSEKQFAKKLKKMPLSLAQDCIQVIREGEVGMGFVAATTNDSEDAKTKAQAINRMLERVDSIVGMNTLKAIQRKDENTGKIHVFVYKIENVTD